MLPKKIIQIGAYEREPWMASKIRSVAPVRNTLTTSISWRGGAGVDEGSARDKLHACRFNVAFNLATTGSVTGLQTSLTRNYHPPEWLVPISPRVTDAISHRTQAAST